MAHLEVQPKKGTTWWIWLLLALIAIALIIYFMRGRTNTETVVSTITDTTAAADRTMVAQHTINYDKVDFNAPGSKYEEVSDSSIGVNSNADYSIYSLGENVLFANDKSNLQNKAEDQLKQVAASINKRFSGATIAVYGHTDTTGSTDHNQQLGAERANTVKDWLVKNANINADKISVHSMGESQQKASGSNQANLQQNRFVRIVAFPQGSNQQ